MKKIEQFPPPLTSSNPSRKRKEWHDTRKLNEKERMLLDRGWIRKTIADEDKEIKIPKGYKSYHCGHGMLIYDPMRVEVKTVPFSKIHKLGRDAPDLEAEMEAAGWTSLGWSPNVGNFWMRIKE